MAFILPGSVYRAEHIEQRVIQFRLEAMANTAEHVRARLGDGVAMLDEPDEVAAIVAWARKHRLRTVLMAEPPVGFWDRVKTRLVRESRGAGFTLVFCRHPWDEALYPHANKGFFQLKKAIPSMIQQACGRR